MSVVQLTYVCWACCLFLTGSLSGGEGIFKSVPTTVKTYENDTVLLPCLVNLDDYTIRWWKRESMLLETGNTFEPNARIKILPNNTLLVSALRVEDNGEYKCQVIRPPPLLPVEQVHAIEVLYPPVVVTIPPNGDIQVNEGAQVFLECQVSGIPHPIVIWTKMGTDSIIDNKPKATIIAYNHTSAGIYQCIANNGVGNPAIGQIKLKVFHAPVITAERTWIHASPGITVDIVCDVISDPFATVEWFLNGRRVLASERVHISNTDRRYTLRILDVRETDFGQYACKATNQLGNQEFGILLSGIANIAVFKNDHVVSSATNFTLIWEVESSSPLIEYKLLFRKYDPADTSDKWVKIVIPADGQLAGPFHSKSYNLFGLADCTVYEAVVLSRNRFGWSKPSNVFRFTTDGTSIVNDEIEEDLSPGNGNEQNPLPEYVTLVGNVCASNKSCVILQIFIFILLLLKCN